ncbi:MAG: WGR domain-containing protein [Sulfobacillus sp.]
MPSHSVDLSRFARRVDDTAPGGPDEQQALDCYWEGHSIDADRHCYRWYRVWVQRDLFGVWCVGTAGGRLGTVRYQQVLHPMADASEAHAWARSQISREMRKGYCEP